MLRQLGEGGEKCPNSPLPPLPGKWVGRGGREGKETFRVLPSLPSPSAANFTSKGIHPMTKPRRRPSRPSSAALDAARRA